MPSNEIFAIEYGIVFDTQSRIYILCHMPDECVIFETQKSVFTV